MASRVKAGYCRVKMKMASRIFSLFMLIFYLSNDSFVIQSALLPSTFLVAHICNSEDPVFKKFSIEDYYIHGLIIYFSEPPNGQYSLYTYKRFKKKNVLKTNLTNLKCQTLLEYAISDHSANLVLLMQQLQYNQLSSLSTTNTRHTI